ncbi:hypothetical protein [Bordetella pseudohinzii]|uniref:Lipoprotein n=1 Tax=Bordetella pseudohinzii TaxID=1331258 RepID=A0A0J6EVD0_9BORD|nr:hypothetical protein [Bordetella pseudohinzii]ANY17313.1 hypothetical protein BBN53_16395 [Bordetella pseudohinzii]KMM24410.1 lipoprotein [Bordetella pseudohinzii]KXA80434.1 hypothetical protein AW878_07430 [Bordetella pseudohinzii]KXA80771.1 hypothetical protein AW877_05945 [Bordetella pseudohinzii]CUI68755.1 Uncharacterised protein [Bordetella pseudohinzii]
MSRSHTLARALAVGAAVAVLAACAPMTQVPPGSPYASVVSQYGQPNFSCQLPDGRQRVIWTQQPMGQYAWGTNLTADGRIEQLEALLTDAHFKRLGEGVWSAERVRCEFGPPAEIRETGLPSVRQVVWAYRYRESSVWNSLMYVYMGRDGQQVTRFHPGPDPMYEERDRGWW